MIPIRSHPAWHPVFEALAYVAGYAVFRFNRKSKGDFLAEPQRWTILAAAAVGAVAGSRILGIAEQWPTVLAAWKSGRLFATNHSPASQASSLRELLCCLPKVLIPKDFGYQNLFRILIIQFIDAEAFDVRSVKKSCIHIAHPDGKRLIPFDTFNMFYRGELESTRLAGLRRMEAEVT
jgi:hypothetical protein